MYTIPKGGSLFPLALLYSLYKFKVSCQLIDHTIYFLVVMFVFHHRDHDILAKLGRK